MNQWPTILTGVASVLLMVGIGAFARYKLWLTQEADQSLLALVLKLMIPCLVADTLIGNPDLRHPLTVALPPLLGFGLLCVSFAVVALALRFFGPAAGLDTPAKKRTFTLAAGLQNYAYLTIPLAQLMFSKTTLGVLLLHNVGVDIGLWTVGVVILTGRVGKGWWKGFLNPIALTIAFSLAANTFDLRRYLTAWHAGLVFTAVHTLALCAIPLALLVVGATILDFLPALSPRGGARTIALGCLMRLGLLPLLFITTACALPASDLNLKRVLIMQGAMPAGLFTTVLARQFGGDPPTALRVGIPTTLLALATIPFWMAAGFKLAGIAP